MSSTLKVEPVNRKKISLTTGLKWVLQKKFGGVISNKIMDLSDIPYLKALIDADIEGASYLMEFIEKHEEVMLNEEF